MSIQNDDTLDQLEAETADGLVNTPTEKTATRSEPGVTKKNQDTQEHADAVPDFVRNCMLDPDESQALPVKERAHVAHIREIAEEVIETHRTSFFRPGTILEFLQERGYGKAANGELIETPKCIGDACGNHAGALRLNSLHICGQKVYDLGTIDMADAAKVDRLEAIQSLKKDVRDRIRIA